MNICDSSYCDKFNHNVNGMCPYHSGNPRVKYHQLLDEAMDETKEGDSFLPAFVNKILHDAKLHENLHHR